VYDSPYTAAVPLPHTEAVSQCHFEAPAEKSCFSSERHFKISPGVYPEPVEGIEMTEEKVRGYCETASLGGGTGEG
jgi:hypothetical protein